MTTARATVTVHGRVQGVCFRMYACERAEDLGLTGWVRNTRDRTVEAVFEGEEDPVPREILLDKVKDVTGLTPHAHRPDKRGANG